MMECYAHQRKQSQPGGWKNEIGRSDDLEPITPGAMDDTMCDLLGGGDLKKALSTAFKGAMAKRESKVRWRKRERRGEGGREGGRERERKRERERDRERGRERERERKRERKREREEEGERVKS